jgi:hypothetical protein
MQTEPLQYPCKVLAVATLTDHGHYFKFTPYMHEWKQFVVPEREHHRLSFLPQDVYCRSPLFFEVEGATPYSVKSQ